MIEPDREKLAEQNVDHALFEITYAVYLSLGMAHGASDMEQVKVIAKDLLSVITQELRSIGALPS